MDKISKAKEQESLLARTSREFWCTNLNTSCFFSNCLRDVNFWDEHQNPPH